MHLLAQLDVTPLEGEGQEGGNQEADGGDIGDAAAGSDERAEPLAVSNAIMEAAHLLLAAYPDAAKGVDRQGSMPLHRACERRPPAAPVAPLVEALVRAYPAACRERDGHKMVPFQRLWHGFGPSAPQRVQAVLVEAYPECLRLIDRDDD